MTPSDTVGSAHSEPEIAHVPAIGTLPFDAAAPAGGFAHSELAHRVTLLEGQVDVFKEALPPKKKKALETIKDYAGLAALLISMATGVFTLWRSMIEEPARRTMEQLAEFQEVVRQLSGLDSDLAQKLGKAASPDERATLVGMANANRMSLLARADSLLPHLEEQVSLTEYLVLSLAEGASYDFAQSRLHAQSALARASNTLERAEALKHLARANFSIGDPAGIAAGESELDEALALVRAGPQDAGLLRKKIDLLGAYIILEGRVDRCERVGLLFPSFEAELASGGLSLAEAGAWRALLREQYTIQSRCPPPDGLELTAAALPTGP